jgi:methionyl-tRNA synthetase
MENTFLVTTPIYYVNDIPHIGHAYTTIAADVLARYHRLAGSKVFFLTGTDEHGQKVQEAARERNITPQAHCDKMVLRFQDLWKNFNISNDDFIRTTEERHKTVVQEILSDLHKKGDIYQASYEGWYCVPDERFWTEKDLIEGCCPECRRPVQQIKESNYFFRMSNYQQWLIEYIEKHDNFILPKTRRNEIMGFLRQPLDDLCISRPRKRLSWGIPIPFDNDYVTYVWFDALINYVSTPGYAKDNDRFLPFWKNAIHLIGKDILTTHSVYWPTMLKAMGLNPPRMVFAHGWWTVEGKKMSKSLHNVVEPNMLIDKYGADAIRFFLLREGTFGTDSDFSHKTLIQRINSDLANDLGNLLNRSLAMAIKYFEGRIPKATQLEGIDEKLQTKAAQVVEQVDSHLKEVAFNRALDDIWELIGTTNKYIDETAPWLLAKDTRTQERLATVIYTMIESLRFIAVLLFPFIPSSTEKMWEALGMNEKLNQQRLDKTLIWGKLQEGTVVTKIPPLFPRIES